MLLDFCLLGRLGRWTPASTRTTRTTSPSSVSLKNYHIPYGICEIADGGELVRITEKPEYNFLVNTGMYVLRPEVLGLIPKDTPFHMTDLIARVQESGRDVSLSTPSATRRGWTPVSGPSTARR